MKPKAMSDRFRRRMAGSALVAGSVLVGVASAQPAHPSPRIAVGPTTSPAVSIATLTARDLRVAVVAVRSSGGTTPTAEVRVALARKIGGGWRETGEMRLPEAYFWRTVTGPRAICKLEITTTAAPKPLRPHVTVRLLRSPSLGCGPLHRFALPDR
jgi:hypothetical protein